MQEVDSSKLIPGEFYYLENKTDKTMKAKGKFTRYYNDEPRFGGEQAAFRIVPSENIKSKKMNAYLNGERGFPLNSYKFYKPLAQNVIDRYQESIAKNPSIAFEKMINQQKLPMRPPTDKISLSSMFAETPEEKNQPREMNPPFIKGDQTFYGTDPDKSSLGTQLKPIYSEYLLDKKTAGRKRRKTRKSRKSRKTKSRRRR
jgi:hypothetical protein